MIRVSAVILFGLSLSLSGTLWAERNYADSDEAEAFIEEMAERPEFDLAELQKLFSEARFSEDVIERISSPAERVLSWGEYRDLFITRERIEAGREFMDEYREALRRAEDETGVPAEIITAIIGVETFYGRHRGTHRVIDALSTLAFDYPPRSDFFRSELREFLLLADEQGFDPLELKGSYAGAMGYGQFISSSYRHYAIDFDDDGVADILDNPVDAIGSVANYFVEHDWQPGAPINQKVDAGEQARKQLTQDNLRPAHRAAEARSLGLAVNEALSDDAPVKLLVLETEAGEETWLAFHNFYVITRYNHSDLYAMAITELAEALVEQEDGE